MKGKSQTIKIIALVIAISLSLGLFAHTQKALDDQLLAPTGVEATITPDQVDLSWNAPGTGVDLWFSHTQADTFDDAIGSGGQVELEMAHRYLPSHLEALGVLGATLTKIAFMGHEPTASYTVKIYTGGSGGTPGSLILTQNVPTINPMQWTEVELSQAITIMPDTELWISIDISTQTGFPACCDAGPALGGFGNMIYFEDGWYTLNMVADSDANWMIKGFATGATGRTMSFVFDENSYKETDEKALRDFPLISASKKGIVLSRNENSVEYDAVENRINNRSVLSYSIWRTHLASMNDESTWTSIATDVAETYYTDETWADVTSGEYKYVVKAVYEEGLSSPAFSNTVYKNMTCNVNISIATEDGLPAAGAEITLTNQDGNLNHIYSAIASEEITNFPELWHGLYDLKITKEGYQTVVEENIIIGQEEYNHPIITLLIRTIIFAENFEGSFPPNGWEIIDNDGDDNSWYKLTSSPYEGSACVASLSYRYGIGALTPDNWMITPQIHLGTGSASTLSFWQTPQDPSYRAEHYSILVSTTDTNFSSFSEIYSETLSHHFFLKNYLNIIKTK